MKQIEITREITRHDYWAYQVADKIRDPQKFAEKLRSYFKAEAGDEIHFYSGATDWRQVGKPEDYAERLIPLIVAIKLIHAVPVIIGCGCFYEEKEALAAMLGIENRCTKR